MKTGGGQVSPAAVAEEEHPSDQHQMTKDEFHPMDQG